MTGGEPPHPPSRSPYPPWQGRGYRRRVGGSGGGSGRNGWAGRRPRSPPPPSSLRPRHPRAGLHKHHRHASQPHPSSSQASYQHHGPPPLSRSLQNRLRASSRSPPPRRLDGPMHRPEQHPHRNDPPSHRAEQHSTRGDQHPHRSEPYPGRGEPHPSRGELHPTRGEPHSTRGESHPTRGESHPTRGESHFSRGEHLPYRGEPGPAHRVDPPDRGGYRGGDSHDHASYRGGDYDYGPARSVQGKSRGEMPSYRSEQAPHRNNGDHSMPYRGEPGPLYRADSGTHRDELDVRRSGGDGSLGRNESQSSYGSWFRNPSKIHKSAKLKRRRLPPHASGTLRMGSQASMKPDSPILSRVGFPNPDRPGANAKPDGASSPANFSTKLSTSGFPGSSGRWHPDPPSRYTGSNSPRASSHQADIRKSGERNNRYQNSSLGHLGPPKRPPYGDRLRPTSPRPDSHSARREGGSRGTGTPPDDVIRAGSRSVDDIGRYDESKSTPRTSLQPNKFVPPAAIPPAAANKRSEAATGKIFGRIRDAREEITARQRESLNQKGAVGLGPPKNSASPNVKRSGEPSSRDAGRASSGYLKDSPESHASDGREDEGSCIVQKAALGERGRPNAPTTETPNGTRRVSSEPDSMPNSDTQQGRRGLIFEREVDSHGAGGAAGPGRTAKLRRAGVNDDRVETKSENNVTCSENAEASVATVPTGTGKMVNGMKVATDLRRDKGESEKGTQDSELLPQVTLEESPEAQNGASEPHSADLDLSTKSHHGDRSNLHPEATTNVQSHRNEERKVFQKDVKTRCEEGKEKESGTDESLITFQGVRASAERKATLAEQKLGTGQEKSMKENESELPSRLGALPCRTDPHELEGAQTSLEKSGAIISLRSSPTDDVDETENRSAPDELPRANTSATKFMPTATQKLELRSVLSSLRLQTASSGDCQKGEARSPSMEQTSAQPGISNLRADAEALSSSLPSDGRALARVEAVEAKEEVKPPQSRDIDLRSILSASNQHDSEVKSKSEPAHTPNVDPRSSPRASSTLVLTPKFSSTPGLELRSVGTEKSPGTAEFGMANQSSSAPLHSSFIDRLSTEKASSMTAPMARSPVSVPAPALALLRSSPRARPRPSVPEFALNQGSQYVRVSSPKMPEPAESGKLLHDGSEYGKNSLLEQVHSVDGSISVLKGRLAHIRLSSPISSSAQDKDKSMAPGHIIAANVACRADEEQIGYPESSPHPMNAALRLVLTHNRAKAAAANAGLRHICSDAEVGLSANPRLEVQGNVQVACELRERVASEIGRQKSATTERRRMLARQYVDVRDAWLRRLKSARDKKSKEKREAMKERDRFLVLCTKGQNARLSSRTSSGRMSTKIFPSLNLFGQVSGTADVDALLAEIAAEGGTPGSRDIWSKTLAEVPDQDPFAVPCDSGSVLVENPLLDFHASRALNPWHFQEKLLFLEKFLVYPKNFRKIASFLEHKSSRECSYFYYMNKLDLNLKQLCRESSTMKRKGTLRGHLVHLARKRTWLESEEVVDAQAEAFLNKQNLIGNGNQQRGLPATELNSSNAVQGMTGSPAERQRSAPMGMLLKKRIYAESPSFSLAEIDKEAFSNAIAKCGTDWKQISTFMALTGKSSTHYREYYRRNRRRLRPNAFDREDTGKSPALIARSPRITPRSSPRGSPSPTQARQGGGVDVSDLPPMMLTDITEEPGPRKKFRKSLSPTVRSAGTRLDFGKTDIEKAVDGDDAAAVVSSVSRKGKTSTWTPEETKRFKELFKKFGRDWKKIAKHMSPKTPTQVKGYWWTVADEVGDGLSVSMTRVPKSERKKHRRSSFDEGISKISPARKDGSPNASPDKPPIRKTTPSRGESPEVEPVITESKKSGSGQVALDTGLVVGNRSSPNVALPIAASVSDVDQSNALQGNKERPAFVSGSKDDLGSKDRSVSKLPSLRSMPPMLRSVPVSKKLSEVSSSNASQLPSSHEEAGHGAVHDAIAGEAQRGNQLRKAAESYGVAELLGSRLNEARDEKTGQG